MLACPLVLIAPGADCRLSLSTVRLKLLPIWLLRSMMLA